MRKVALSIGQYKFLKVLDASGGADEHANAVVMFILTKIKKFRLRKPWESLTPDEGSRAMIASLNTTIRRKLVEAIENTARDRAMRLANPHNVAEVMDGMESPALVDNGDLQRLIEHLGDEETIDRIAMRCPAKCIFALEEVIKQQIGAVASGQELVAYEDLRPDLRGKISPEVHSLCIARIVREIEEFTLMVE